MKRYLPAVVLLVLIGSCRGSDVVVQTQQSGPVHYTLRCAFWYDSINTDLGHYWRDFDRGSTQLPIHFSQKQFHILDSLLTAIGFWSFPDLIAPPQRLDKNGNPVEELLLPSPGPSFFSFSINGHTKSVKLSFPLSDSVSEKIYTIEKTIQGFLETQSGYRDLPRKRVRM